MTREPERNSPLMRTVRFRGVFASVVWCWGSLLAQAADEPTAKRHALLVGCTKYTHLAAKHQLEGPGNDVRLIRGLLIEKFGFQPADITEMTEASPPTLRPDREQIVAEMEKLRQRAGAGDEVFILFAGHGSQQPDENRDEDDGLDEVFLPADVAQWQANEKVVKGITDDEIGLWIDKLREGGAFVFYVADACHSGTLNRGPEEPDATTVKTRAVDADDWVGKDTVQAARAAAAARPAGEKKPYQAGLDVKEQAAMPVRGGFAALAAVPDTALEQEHAMPPNDLYDDPRYGRLSYALHQVLTKAQAPLTYRELAQHLSWYYLAQGWMPLGGLAGDSRDRQVLGKKEWKDRSAQLLTRTKAGTWRINQGTAHGLSRNSIIKVLPPAGSLDGDKVLGYMRVISDDPVSGFAVPTKHGDDPTTDPAKWPNPARGEIEVVDYGELKIDVRARPASDEELKELNGAGDRAAAPSAEQAAAVERALVKIAGEKNALVREARPSSIADLYLLTTSAGVLLCRPYEPVADEAAALRPAFFGPYKFGPTLKADLEQALRTTARALNLRRISADDGLRDPATRRVNVHVALAHRPTAEGEFAPLEAGMAIDRGVFKGEMLRITITNQGRLPVDITVLYLDAAFGVTSLYPTPKEVLQGERNVVEPEASSEVTIKINDDTVGLEEIFVLAVEHQPGGTIDYAFLAQPGLSFSAHRGDGPQRPLDELIDAAQFKGTRGTSTAASAGEYSVQRRAIMVRKQAGR